MKKIIKAKKTKWGYKVYFSRNINISYNATEFQHMFNRFCSIRLFNTKYILVPKSFKSLFGFKNER